jgi:PBP1b-binding outer membrane lipoprotein LpoB
MRRLSFLTSILSGALLFSCSNRAEGKKSVEPIVENTKAQIENATDTAVATSTEVNNDTIIRKVKNKGGTIKEAPKHGTPDQQKLDSIKAAKAKNK